LYGNGRISQETPSQREYYLGDALGSVRQLFDRTGELRLGESYEPYGEVLSGTGDVASSYSFAGEWLDSTGLIFLRARNYNPHVGRFVSRDAWGGDFDSPISLNRWVYANASPVIYSDPSGLAPLTPQPDHRDLTDWLVSCWCKTLILPAHDHRRNCFAPIKSFQISFEP
jgi:RHS repeat-associated protein